MFLRSFKNSVFKTFIRGIRFPKKYEITEDIAIVSEDGGIIACWHPPKSMPYKYSMEIPQESAPILNSVYNFEHVNTYNLNGPSSVELKEIFLKESFYFKKRLIGKYSSVLKHNPEVERKGL